MKKGWNEISKAGAFIITSLVLIVIGGIILATNEKVAFHKEINSHHNQFFDSFFQYWTYVGDGVVIPVLMVLIGVFSIKKYGLSVLIAGLSTLILVGGLSQVFKRLLYGDAMRPYKLIGHDQLYYVPGLKVHSFHSFPSGHTTAGFAFFAIIACVYFSKNRLIQVILAVLAGLVGYSRMYLSQHFLEDVVAGAGLGIFCFVAVFFIKGILTKKLI
ncbi:MAG: membrane-associated phospholipid phosphatase [Salibacteraceae bacterium]|jgi:membrane-associated phospholipid phosphatase